MYLMLFFFSSGRRHTRYIGDWSSDVVLARRAAFQKPQLDELEVLLQRGRHRLGLRSARADQEIARVPSQAGVLDALEGVGALEQRIDRAAAARGFEQLEQRDFRVEQRHYVGSARFHDAMARRG